MIIDGGALFSGPSPVDFPSRAARSVRRFGLNSRLRGLSIQTSAWTGVMGPTKGDRGTTCDELSHEIRVSFSDVGVAIAA